MTWRTILVQSPGKLNLHQRQISFKSNESSQTLPLEDVAVVILETPQVVITAALLSAIAEQGIVLITCGEDHHPNGLLTGFHGYHRQRLQMERQLAWSEPFKKRCWQYLIKQKLLNQAYVLALAGLDEDAAFAEAQAQQVLSGDSDNRESVVARRYWLALQGASFTRNAKGSFNAAINYAYAIVRAALARNLVSSGFLPAIGLHHHNQLNTFNLADDLIEPFRPWVDLQVSRLESLDSNVSGELNMVTRQQLAALGGWTCSFSGEQVSLLRACELAISTLSQASEHKDHKVLRSICLNS